MQTQSVGSSQVKWLQLLTNLEVSISILSPWNMPPTLSSFFDAYNLEYDVRFLKTGANK